MHRCDLHARFWRKLLNGAWKAFRYSKGQIANHWPCTAFHNDNQADRVENFCNTLQGCRHTADVSRAMGPRA